MKRLKNVEKEKSVRAREVVEIGETVEDGRMDIEHGVERE